jgi:peroxiredoxin
MVQAQHSASIGDTLPDITLPLLSGGKLSTGDLRGKRLLLFFWGSW